MALFGKKSEEDDEAPQDGPEPPQAEIQPVDEDDGQPSGSGTQAAGEAQSGKPSQNALDVEDALKELSARMAVLSSNIEGVKESRGDLEDKLGTVEERMSRLGALAEAVSSQYNPFISEDEPADPSWTPGEDNTPEPQAETLDGAPFPAEADGVVPGTKEETEALGSDPEPDAPSPSAAGDEQVDAGPGPSLPGEDPGIPPDVSPETLDASTNGTAEQATEPDPLDQSEPGDPVDQALSGLEHQAGPDDALEQNLLMLEWVGLMLRRVGRAGLLDLLDYYQNLGWLSRDIKDRATRVAIGVEAPDRVGDGHWRGDVGLHRRSLLAIQRLEGNRVPAAEVESLEMDLRRLFEER